ELGGPRFSEGDQFSPHAAIINYYDPARAAETRLRISGSSDSSGGLRGVGVFLLLAVSLGGVVGGVD
ncbi:MAG: hypothetical protein U0990_00005, partial [Candidatus Nanopelagicales bacterium]|nr:hypothetical protein [Candidatus Nanopelagicales bacterium]